MKTKFKLLLNIGLMGLILAVMVYLLQNSLKEIIEELKNTSGLILLAVIALGTIYLFIEGRSVKEIAISFQPGFTSQAGLIAVCYSAFYRIVTFGAGTLISEVNYYRKKGLKISQGVGVAALHMVMYKLAVVTYAIIGLVIQFQLLLNNAAANMIWAVILGVIVTLLIIIFLLTLSVSINVQVLFVKFSNKFFKTKRLRHFVDQCNQQIYSLRETVFSILNDHTAFLRIYLWNLLKLIPWYVIPYIVLVGKHPEIDFLLTLSLISFTVVLAGVIPTPAGIGSFEFIYMLLFKPIIGTVDAASSLLLYRFATFIWPFLIGFIYVMSEKQKTIQEELEEVKKERA